MRQKVLARFAWFACLLLLACFVAACSKSKAGNPCTKKEDCDQECLLGIQCIAPPKTVNACSREKCTGTGQGTCKEASDECVPITGTQDAYCVPKSVCQ